MKTSSIVWTVIIVVVVVAGGIYLWTMSQNPSSMPYAAAPSSTTQTASTTPTSSPSGPTSQPVILITLRNATKAGVGTYLVAANGMTLYTYSGDSSGVSNCTGQCAAAWPPYTVNAETANAHAVGAGINGTMGTIMRADGSLQVTYNGMPLYFWSQDSKPGDTTGNGVGGFAVVTL
jgi:predicted lipoprotein with Yx(FWY)xxD motif